MGQKGQKGQMGRMAIWRIGLGLIGHQCFLVKLADHSNYFDYKVVVKW